MKVLEEELPTTGNKTVSKCQEQQRRRKVVELPSTEERSLLYNFVEKSMMKCFSELNQHFSIPLWKKLASATLILVQIFNRRRSGEVEEFSLMTSILTRNLSSKKILHYSILLQRNLVGILRNM